LISLVMLSLYDRLVRNWFTTTRSKDVKGIENKSI
jgi:hypothetical protein